MQLVLKITKHELLKLVLDSTSDEISIPIDNLRLNVEESGKENNNSLTLKPTVDKCKTLPKKINSGVIKLEPGKNLNKNFKELDLDTVMRNAENNLRKMSSDISYESVNEEKNEIDASPFDLGELDF